jgi:hypothetical protein
MNPLLPFAHPGYEDIAIRGRNVPRSLYSQILPAYVDDPLPKPTGIKRIASRVVNKDRLQFSQ